MSYKTVTVAGLGKAGLPIACYLTKLGYRVIGYDINEKLIEQIQSGQNPLPMEYGVDPSLIEATINPDRAFKYSDIVYIIVPTPESSKGLSPQYVWETLNTLRLVKFNGLIIVGSTLDPRDASSIISGDKVVYSPPLLRLGSVVADMENAKLGLIGYNSKESAQEVVKFWKWNQSGIHVVAGDPITIATAKLAINVTLSLRIGWANEVASIARSLGANSSVVLEAMKFDPRIGNGYLEEGWIPSGECLPRDLDMWSKLGYGGLSNILLDVHEKTADMIVSNVSGMIMETEHTKIAIFGITYNPRALGITNSQGLAIATALRNLGKEVIVYDPAQKWFMSKLEQFTVAETPEEALQASTAVIFCTPWPEFRYLDVGKRFEIDLVKRKK